MKVTLTEPDIAGSYVVSEQRDDGILVLEPLAGPSEEELLARSGGGPLTYEEFERHFGDFPTDGEG